MADQRRQCAEVLLVALMSKRIFQADLPPPPTAYRIVVDMKKRGPAIRFDLTSDCGSQPHSCSSDVRCGRYWKERPEEFWKEFGHTNEILVPHRFEDWIIGQDEAKEKLRLNLLEWPRRLKDLAELAESNKPVSQILPQEEF